jgi:HTH-type transcriptional regulator, sugar sensing transcriptional regulator
MNEQQLISHIEELGLSNKEARVFVACLKVGPSPVQRIADQAAIKRVTAYVVLESLVGLGLVSQSVKGKKTFFVAEDPSNLERLLERRESELKDQRVNFEHALPELAKLKAIPKELPEVKFYDGADGVRSLFTTFFVNYKGDERDIFVVSNVDQLHSFFPERRSAKGNPDRIRQGIRSHLVYTSERGPIYHSTDANSNRLSRFLPPGKYPLSGDISVIDDYVIMISLVGPRPMAVTLRNRDIAESMRSFFQMAWDIAGETKLTT